MFFGGKMLPHALSIFDLAILHTARKWQIGKLINLTMFSKGMSKDKVLSVITGAKMLKVFPAIFFIIFWDFLMFHQIFLSPQVKRCAIITYKHGICELPHELTKVLRLRSCQTTYDLGSYEIRKHQESV